MPGSSVSDFKADQYVAFTQSRFDKFITKRYRICKVLSISSGIVEVESTLLKGTKETGGYYPKNLLTADEMEETLYHCSYCGVKGHNRRTCPKLDEFAAESGGSEVKSCFKGDLVSADNLLKGDFFMVAPKPHAISAHANKWKEGTFEVVNNLHGTVKAKVIDNGGDTSLGAFGHVWTFEEINWDFFEAFEVGSSGIKDFKMLPVWSLIEIVLPVSRLVLLYGPPGTGKTTAGNFLGDPKEVYNLTLTEETPAAELRGHFIPKGNEFVWMDGPALSAFKKGARLVLNEIDKASGDALTFCHALLDDPGIARITLPYKDETGENVSVCPNENFHVVATMNGDPDDLPEALRDRFAVRINVDKVHPDAIKSLPPDLRKIAAKGISKDGERSVSIRGWNAFVQLREIIGEENAAMAVFGPRAKTVLNTIKIDSITSKKK